MNDTLLYRTTGGADANDDCAADFKVVAVGPLGKMVLPDNAQMALRRKRHGLTLTGKTRKVKPCLQVFSIIRSEYLECNIRRRFFGQDDLLWRCSSQYTEVSELSISPSHPIRPDAEGLQDASCRSPQGRTGCEYPAALLQRLRIDQATAPCICRAEKALHEIFGTLCS